MTFLRDPIQNGCLYEQLKAHNQIPKHHTDIAQQRQRKIYYRCGNQPGYLGGRGITRELVDPVKYDPSKQVELIPLGTRENAQFSFNVKELLAKIGEGSAELPPFGTRGLNTNKNYI